MPDDDPFRRLLRTLRRHKIVGTLRSFKPDPRQKRARRYRPRPVHLASVQDTPRVQLPSLEHALRERQAVRWHTRCRRCGVSWTGRMLDTTQPAVVLASLAVMRVPCPVCWAQAWPAMDQATRDAWVVPSWLTPRWR